MSETGQPTRNPPEDAREGDVGVPRRVLRTVTPPYRGRPDAEMTAIGLAYAAGLVILLLPLLPLLAAAWVAVKLIDFLTAQVDRGERPG